MNEHITREQDVSGTVNVWAIPEKEWDSALAQYVYTGKWRYTIKTGSAYEDGAVKVSSHTVTVRMPGGIDIVTAAIKTLEEERDQAWNAHNKTLDDIQRKIDSLMQLTHQKDPNVIEGESEEIVPTVSVTIVEPPLPLDDEIPF